MTKLGDRMKEGLREAITMTKLMKENEAIRAENAKLRAELREADVMLLNQARLIRDYQDAAAALKETPDESKT